MLLPDLELCWESVPIHPSLSPSLLLVSMLSFRIQVQEHLAFHVDDEGLCNAASDNLQTLGLD